MGTPLVGCLIWRTAPADTPERTEDFADERPSTPSRAIIRNHAATAAAQASASKRRAPVRSVCRCAKAGIPDGVSCRAGPGGRNLDQRLRRTGKCRHVRRRPTGFAERNPLCSDRKALFEPAERPGITRAPRKEHCVQRPQAPGSAAGGGVEANAVPMELNYKDISQPVGDAGGA